MEHTLPTQRVFVVGRSDSVFEEGIAHLLSSRTDWQVFRVTYTDDDSFLEEVAKDRPDVILVNETVLPDAARTLELLTAMPLADLRVFVIQPDDNAIDVYARPSQIAATAAYEKHKVVITEVEDLLDLVARHHV